MIGVLMLVAAFDEWLWFCFLAVMFLKESIKKPPIVGGFVCYTAAMTELVRVPMPSMATVMVSPGARWPTPAGVPL